MIVDTAEVASVVHFHMASVDGVDAEAQREVASCQVVAAAAEREDFHRQGLAAAVVVDVRKDSFAMAAERPQGSDLEYSSFACSVGCIDPSVQY